MICSLRVGPFTSELEYGTLEISLDLPRFLAYTLSYSVWTASIQSLSPFARRSTPVVIWELAIETMVLRT